MKEVYRVSGLMSGSSLDGLDLAFCEFAIDQGKWSYILKQAECREYDQGLKKKLREAHGWDIRRIRKLDRDLGDFFAGELNSFHRKFELKPDLISSHGHTILHEPARGVTFQAGNGMHMARITGIPVVCDFRSLDVANGGQGAPLVPIGDRLLFSDFDACVNLGGFANISFEKEGGQRIAYDTGPVNMALNHVAGKMGMDFDRDGCFAEKGQVRQELVEKLNALDYYHQAPPKSLGREWFLTHFLPLIEKSSLETKDLLASISEHISMHVLNAINSCEARNILFTGGGTLNKDLMRRISLGLSREAHLPPLDLIQYKEALVFAFLGVLRIRGEINCLASVTGGARDLSCGVLHQP